MDMIESQSVGVVIASQVGLSEKSPEFEMIPFVFERLKDFDSRFICKYNQ